jgi:hypothetical protein
VGAPRNYHQAAGGDREVALELQRCPGGQTFQLQGVLVVGAKVEHRICGRWEEVEVAASPHLQKDGNRVLALESKQLLSVHECALCVLVVLIVFKIACCVDRGIDCQADRRVQKALGRYLGAKV